ncbi:MAG TPA: benzoyl-CoA 2,3-epoxidase subunit BoxB [Candidatus Acidoferrales bacterium]|nr:benzoyl-CoA 2,3-epoxidase subunit BoxB [Candidatus Acidoferrales bacterium]
MTLSADYTDRIPNNVDLRGDRRLQRALEAWQPRFMQWWRDLGPDLIARDVYLRTAISADRDGWAHFGHIPLEEYRWGIFLADREPDRRIAFGEHMGTSAWQQIPGEYRADLQRLLVVQGDTEPASVEQQRLLGFTAPSLYDLRNLFQVNVEEGRHLWAMVYLLHAFFGREGRDQAEQLLLRHSGSVDAPRILGAFNEPTRDWLAFFMFTYFTDRDGKFQLGTLAESGFDPLSRTCRFMLREEAHHMMVGTTGIDRVVRRTAELMREHNTDDIARHGGIPLDIIQRYLNFHYSVSLDLFGGERSTNVANYFTAGLKGRWQEERRDDDHQLTDATAAVDVVVAGRIESARIPALTALNQDLRSEYFIDCNNGVRRWNRLLETAGIERTLALPHHGFNRRVGAFAGLHVTPGGELIDDATWERRQAEWLPTAADYDHIQSLMTPVFEPGKMAGWIAPPATGINGQPVEYEYVRLA